MLYACEKCKKLYKTPEEVQKCEKTHEEERLKLAAFNAEKEEKRNEINALRQELKQLSDKISSLESEYVSTYGNVTPNGIRWLFL